MSRAEGRYSRCTNRGYGRKNTPLQLQRTRSLRLVSDSRASRSSKADPGVLLVLHTIQTILATTRAIGWRRWTAPAKRERIEATRNPAAAAGGTAADRGGD